jgi:acyl dehydratase
MPLVKIDTPDSLKNFIGREIAVTGWFVLTQDRIQQFAEATGDTQWIHLDRERAEKESPYGKSVAHGFLTLSLLSFLMQQAIEIENGVRHAINYGLNRVRFPSPVRAGSRIRAHFTLMSVKDVADAVEPVFSVSVECEGSDKPCCVAEWIVRYYR